MLLTLTSYNRMLRYLGQQDGTLIKDTIGLRRDIAGWIGPASEAVQKFLNYEIDLVVDQYDYRQVHYNQAEFMCSHRPVDPTKPFDVYEDIQGLWAGNQALIPLTYVGAENASLALPLPLQYTARKAVRLHYTGGMSTYGTISQYSVADASQIAVDQFMVGELSDAEGIVRGVSGNTVLVEILFGVFQLGETVDTYNNEDRSGGVLATTLLSVIVQKSVAEISPSIVRAAEIQVRHWWRHKNDFETTGTSKDGVSMRKESTSNYGSLEPEAKQLLMPFVGMI